MAAIAHKAICRPTCVCRRGEGPNTRPDHHARSGGPAVATTNPATVTVRVVTGQRTGRATSAFYRSFRRCATLRSTAVSRNAPAHCRPTRSPRDRLTVTDASCTAHALTRPGDCAADLWAQRPQTVPSGGQRAREVRRDRA